MRLARGSANGHLTQGQSIMPNLDQPRIAQLPSRWSPEMVQGRLVDAFKIEMKLPKERYAKVNSSSSWPVAPLVEFTDVIFWDDARQRIWESWYRAKGAHAFEITLMEQSIDWLMWLPEGERRCLRIWAEASAKGLRLRKILKMRGWPRSTFYRAVDRGSVRISERLNAEGVQIR